ncbi:TonB family protein [Roseiterribacter gracilis]|uniref:TonB family protein n=1 Tax=Roseiterribacter gracilis TaxID=2812848 RepID=UPI003B428E6F
MLALAPAACTNDAARTSAVGPSSDVASALEQKRYRRVAGPIPTMPQRAWVERVEGHARVEVVTEATGRVVAARVLEEDPVGYEFGAHALAAVSRWTFEPASASQTFAYTVYFKFR